MAAIVRPLRQLRRQILQTVYRQIDTLVEQRFFNFLREQALAAHFVQRGIRDAVARRTDHLNPGFHAARFQASFDMVGLPQSKLRTT